MRIIGIIISSKMWIIDHRLKPDQNVCLNYPLLRIESLTVPRDKQTFLEDITPT